ncbi:hypothetical protein niasHS_009867 [Heterodera schachtii]|uniref:RING-type domain-containing protein n=1 Tax=Heterodera schachtii TaxID=97005 RepID=A0ABD2JAN2_HETSC
MRQNDDKKGQNAKREKGEKVADKAKANLQRMLQLLGTAIDQIDDKEQISSGVGFVGKQKRRTKRGLINLNKSLIILFWIISPIIVIVIIAVGAVGVPLLVVAAVAGVVLDGVVKGSVVAVNSIRHLHRPSPIVPPAEMTIINKVTQRIVQAGEPSAECAICLGNYEPKESVDKLPCEGKHEFHTSCIQLWFKQNTTCPLCRTKISVVPAE